MGIWIKQQKKWFRTAYSYPIQNKSETAPKVHVITYIGCSYEVGFNSLPVLAIIDNTIS